MANATNPLARMSPAELHDEGLGYLHRARQEFVAAPSAHAAASIAIASFFASMSAENLGSLVGAHRGSTPPHGISPINPEAFPAPVGPNEFTGHHG